MNKFGFAGFALLLIGAASFSTAATSPIVTVLGIPVGGKLASEPRRCSLDDPLAPDVPSICQIGEPLALGPFKRVAIMLPGSDSRPQWAAHASFSLLLGRTKLIEHFTIETYSPDDAETVTRSISQRFGAPTRTKGVRETFSASWIKPDVYVDVLCYEKGCKVDFMSAAAYARWQADLVKRKKIDDARPTSL